MAGDPRHRAREVALKVLYECEVGRADVDAVLESWRDARPDVFDDGVEVVWPRLEDDVWDMAAQLARGTTARLRDIDPLIERRAANWRLERMSTVDRLILRLGVFELISGTPRAVVIDEALELARTFSTELAVKFINGVLDGVGRDLEQEPASRDP